MSDRNTNTDAHDDPAHHDDSHETNTEVLPSQEPIAVTDIQEAMQKALSCWKKYQETANPSDLDTAIAYQERIIDLATDDDQNKSIYLVLLGVELRQRFLQSRLDEDINRAILAQEEAVQLTPNESSSRPPNLTNLCVSLQLRFQHLGAIADLDRAIAVQDEAIQLISSENGNKRTYLNNLVTLLLRRIEHRETLAHLERAITVQEEVIRLTPDDHPEKLLSFSNLGWLLSRRFERQYILADLDKAISMLDEAFRSTSEQHPSRLLYATNLGTALQRRFERLGSLGDLDKAISVKDEAVRLSPDPHHETDRHLSNLGISLLSRFEQLGALSDLNRAISLQEEALSLVSASDESPYKQEYLNHLGVLLRRRFKKFGSLPDLDRAIVLQEQAVLLTPDAHPDKHRNLNNLGTSLWCHFQRTGISDSIDRAISMQQQSVILTPEGHLGRPRNLNNLGMSLQSRFDQLGALSDIDSAISAHDEAVRLTPAEDPNKHVYLNNLGVSLQSQFDRFGRMADLDRAVIVYDEAIQLSPDKHPEKPMSLHNLGVALQRRFDRLGQLADLDRAILMSNKAVRLAPDIHPDKQMFLNSLGSSLQDRFVLLGTSSDIDKAVSTQEKAVQLTPDGHPDKRINLTNLGVSLQRRFKHEKALTDIDRAISVQGDAIQLVPDEHPGKYVFLGNLGVSLHSRAEQTGALEDLDKAIMCKDDAMRLIPDGHPSAVFQLRVLGQSLQYRFEKLNQPVDLDRAVKSFAASARAAGSSRTHLRSALAWARLAMQNPPVDDRLLPLEAGHVIVNLVPRLAWLGYSIEKRYKDIASIANAVNYAAAIACSAGESELALEWLEQGRSIVWGQMLNLRSPVDELGLQHPALATEIRDVAQRLDRAALKSTAPERQGKLARRSLEQAAQEHRRLAERYEELLVEARQRPGFERFLLPRKLSELSKAASLGPVVIINVEEARCDALILRNVDGSPQVDHAPLVAATFRDIKIANESFVTRLVRGRIHKREPYNDKSQSTMAEIAQGEGLRKMKSVPSRLPPTTTGDLDPEIAEILKMLWLTVAKPILDHLGYLSSAPPEILPRITWCPTGPLVFLPLHAAGCYGRDEEQRYNKVYHHVVSSYTPNLSALISNQQISGPSENNLNLVAVSQTETTGLNDLPGTIVEINAIKARIETEHFRHLDGSQATTRAMLRAMNECDWIHLACHGAQHPDDPMKSAFMLYDGRLELSTISQQNLPHARFAFLSACQTAKGDTNLPEEAVHLAAGMLMAGYRSVIGTMWSIRDEDGPIVADEVYKYLVPEMRTEEGQVAYALHKAVKVLRERSGEQDFMSWVPFIHLGI